MGFKKPNLNQATGAIRQSLVEISSPYNDGWTSSSCKQELYQLKCWLDDEYKKLPTFVGEEKWEHDRLIDLLRNK
jgi:hypothetical protein